jgi:hypothetical protein
LKIGCLSGLGPVVGQELAQLRRGSCCDSSEHVGQIGYRVDLVLGARGQERQVNRRSLAADIGAHEKAVLPVMSSFV